MKPGEKKSGGIGAKAKTIPGRITKGDGKAQTEGGHGAKGSATGSDNLKGNKNKGHTRSSSGSGGAQTQGGKSGKATVRELSQSTTRDLVRSMHSLRGSTLGR